MELKNQLIQGNEKAFSFLMETYHHKLCTYACSLTKSNSQAKDIVQNVFIKVWEKRKLLKEVDSVKSFLYRCTYNEFINQYRKEKNIHLTIDNEQNSILEQLIQLEEETILQQKITTIKKEIKNLPPRCKETFLLSKEYGLTNTEIAETMKVSVKTVERQINKAFKILKQTLNKKYDFLFFLYFSKILLW